MSLPDYKGQARRLADHLSAVHGIKLKHASILEAVAALHGVKNWNTLTAAAQGEVASAVPAALPASDGLCFGHKAVIPDCVLTQHTVALGHARYGLSDFIESILKQQIERGGGFLFLDGMPDAEFAGLLRRLMSSNNREHQYQIWDALNAHTSETYNPAEHGSVEDVTEKLLSLLPAGGSPGADFYLQQTHAALYTLLAGMRAKGVVPSLSQLVELLMSASALEAFEASIPEGSEARRACSFLLDQFRVKTKNGVHIDISKVKGVLGGAAGRLAQLSMGKFGQVLNCSHGDICISDTLACAKGLYLGLPSIGQSGAGSALGKMFLWDLECALRSMSTRQKQSQVPFLVVLHGTTLLLSASRLVRLMAEAHRANVALVFAASDVQELAGVDTALMDSVLSNVSTKLFFKLTSRQSANALEQHLADMGTDSGGPLADIRLQGLLRMEPGKALLLQERCIQEVDTRNGTAN